MASAKARSRASCANAFLHEGAPQRHKTNVYVTRQLPPPTLRLGRHPSSAHIALLLTVSRCDFDHRMVE